jgi:hypothetical protein
VTEINNSSFSRPISDCRTGSVLSETGGEGGRFLKAASTPARARGLLFRVLGESRGSLIGAHGCPPWKAAPCKGLGFWEETQPFGKTSLAHSGLRNYARAVLRHR